MGNNTCHYTALRVPIMSGNRNRTWMSFFVKNDVAPGLMVDSESCMMKHTQDLLGTERRKTLCHGIAVRLLRGEGLYRRSDLVSLIVLLQVASDNIAHQIGHRAVFFHGHCFQPCVQTIWKDNRHT